MTASSLNGDQFEGSAEKQSPLAITDGEINFLWSFIQGSIMDPDTWNRLLDSYGFCERHAWIHLNIESAFREQYLLGPTILYQALLEKALHAIFRPRLSIHSTMRRLRATDACMLCALGVAQASAGAAPLTRLQRGRNIGPLRLFAGDLKALWRGYVCDVCEGQPDGADDQRRCRRHVLSHLRQHKALSFSAQSVLLGELYKRVTRYQNSFVAGGAATTDQDRAALIGAIGWCSGWRPLFAVLDTNL